MNYTVNQFVMFKFDEGLGIQNNYGFTVLTNKVICRFFEMLDQDNRLHIDNQTLHNFFGEDFEEVKEYLLRTKLIKNIPSKETYESIVIITNNKVISKSINFNKSGTHKKIKESFFEKNSDILQYIDETQFDSKTLLIIALVPFDYIDFVKINDLISKKNVIYLFAFSYNSTLYVTNLHKKSWFNPCPKCFFSHLESGLRAYSKNTSETTFQTIVDLLYNKDIVFSPTLILNNRNVLNLTNVILSFDSSEDINILSNRVVNIKLKNDITYDQAIHWELCDCFE